MENQAQHYHQHSSIPLFVPPPSPVFSSTTNSNWVSLFHPKLEEEEELRQAVLCAALELESTKAAAQDELISRMEVETAHLRALLEATTRERDEARKQCHQALQLLLYAGGGQHSSCHQSKPEYPLSLPPEEENKAASASSEESSSIVSSPTQPKEAAAELEVMGCSMLAAPNGKELPEKGKLLEAVVRAGPLLQNLLLAGPLPQWRHPPPAFHSFEIPPVSIAVTGTAAAFAAAALNKEINKEEGGSKKRKTSRSSWPLSMKSTSNGEEGMEYCY